MKQLLSGTKPTENGQALIELALTLPLLLLILVGMLDLGRVYYAQITITNAAREGARYGASSPFTDSDIKAAAVAEAASSGFTITTSNVSVTKSGIGPGDTLTVTVSVSYPLVSAFLFRGAALSLNNAATMTILQGVGD